MDDVMFVFGDMDLSLKDQLKENGLYQEGMDLAVPEALYLSINLLIDMGILDGKEDKRYIGIIIKRFSQGLLSYLEDQAEKLSEDN